MMKLALIPSAILYSSLVLEITAALAVASCGQGPQGPQGPPGSAGAAGPPGPAGPAGTFSSAGVKTIVKTQKFSGVVGSGAAFNMLCPPDHPVPVAGGYDAGVGVIVTASRPEAADCPTHVVDCSDGTHGAPTGWIFEMRNTDTAQHALTSFVVCSP